MPKGKRIPLIIPPEFYDTGDLDKSVFVFKYLRDLGFSRSLVDDHISLDEISRILYQPYFDKLRYNKTHLTDPEILGGFFLIHKAIPDVYSYEDFCKTVIEFRGGFSITYKKVSTKKDIDIFKFRDNTSEWMETVISELDEELDVEVRHAEYLKIMKELKKLYKKIDGNSRAYQTILMPGSFFQKSLNKVKERIFHG